MSKAKGLPLERLNIVNIHKENAHSNDDDSTPRVEQLPGGNLRVSLNRNSLPLIKPSSAAEAKHREEYVRKAKERQERYPKLPTIPEKKKDEK